MFFYKVEGHMPKLSSFGRGKTIRPKKSLTSLLHAALQLELGYAFFWTGKMGFTALGVGFNDWETDKKFRKWEWDFPSLLVSNTIISYNFSNETIF